MEEQIKKLEERRAALVKQANESKDLAEVKSINQQLITLNDDIEALRSIQAKQDTKQEEETDERTKANQTGYKKSRE